jgi:uncharacterized protein
MTKTKTKTQTRWIQAYGGIKIFPVEAAKSNLLTLDIIAHSLSNLCRFTGHTREFYSVAQHSVIVADYVFEKTACGKAAQAALLHDAAEVVLGDDAKPVKDMLQVQHDTGHLERLVDIENDWLDCILMTFGLNAAYDDHFELIKYADKLAMATEARDLMSPLAEGWEVQEANGYEVLPVMIQPWSPEAARRRFKASFEWYGNKRGEC